MALEMTFALRSLIYLGDMSSKLWHRQNAEGKYQHIPALIRSIERKSASTEAYGDEGGRAEAATPSADCRRYYDELPLDVPPISWQH